MKSMHGEPAEKQLEMFAKGSKTGTKVEKPKRGLLFILFDFRALMVRRKPKRTPNEAKTRETMALDNGRSAPDNRLNQLCRALLNDDFCAVVFNIEH